MTIQETIQKQLTDYSIVLYMKGTPVFPQCGFSAKATGLLKECLEAINADTTRVLYVNVLENNEIREGIKQFGQWPTIPQLYLKGELVGGSDIMIELFNQGELQKQVAEALKA
jgi:monothiol glutaredoxin